MLHTTNKHVLCKSSVWMPNVYSKPYALRCTLMLKHY